MLAPMSDDPQTRRLTDIDNTSERDGAALWPIAIILVIGAGIIGTLMVPCIGLRINYIMNAPDTSKMSVWQMHCVPEGKDCVCTQSANAVQGGEACVVRKELRVQCRPIDTLE